MDNIKFIFVIRLDIDYLSLNLSLHWFHISAMFVVFNHLLCVFVVLIESSLWLAFIHHPGCFGILFKLYYDLGRTNYILCRLYANLDIANVLINNITFYFLCFILCNLWNIYFIKAIHP